MWQTEQEKIANRINTEPVRRNYRLPRSRKRT